jgi:glycosyltransferase involved in cell wall biosynthesis
MHILFLTDNFPPEVNAPASRTFEHCREWVKAGHKVTVITGAPNFPAGKVFDGYANKWRTQETIQGIDVIRVWTYISANEGFLKRTLDYASFMISGALAALDAGDVDVIVATSPHLFTPCAAYVAGLLKRRPYVFELRDLWPESIRAVGAMKNAWILNALEKLELFLYRRAAEVVSVTHAFKDNLISRGIEATKISVVTNGADLARFAPRPRDEALAAELGLSGKTVIGYVGTHGMAHALTTVLDAAELLKASELTDDVGFLLLGDGAEKAALKADAAARKLDNVVFADTVPRNEVVRYWSLIDLSVIHLKRTPLFETVIPSKLFECLAMGIPVLHGVAGESAAIVQREGVGITFEPENASALARSIAHLAGDPERRAEMARNAVAAARRYDRTELAGAMLKTLERVNGEARVLVTPQSNEVTAS